MKFRNPRTGEVYNVVDSCNNSGFCSDYECHSCPMCYKAPYLACSEFVNLHPREAASLFGYEVIEDDKPVIKKEEKTMKFKDPKTGEVFDDILSAWEAYKCPGPCGDCNLSGKCNEVWLKANPEEAARLMGYEAIDDDPMPDCIRAAKKEKCAVCGKETDFVEYCAETPLCSRKCVNKFYDRLFVEEATKLLENWTLKEVKGYCDARNVESNSPCTGCPFARRGSNSCRFSGIHSPCDLDLSDKPIWTKQEIEDAKTIKRLFLSREPLIIERRSNGSILLRDENSCWAERLKNDCFPSLGPGETARPDDIIGGAE